MMAKDKNSQEGKYTASMTMSNETNRKTLRNVWFKTNKNIFLKLN